MKIELTKKGMTRWCHESDLELMTSAGWQVKTPSAVKELSDSMIVVRQPAKSKGAAKETLDNANQQGDE
jgi:hypothetical protein